MADRKGVPFNNFIQRTLKRSSRKRTKFNRRLMPLIRLRISSSLTACDILLKSIWMSTPILRFSNKYRQIVSFKRIQHRRVNSKSVLDWHHRAHCLPCPPKSSRLHHFARQNRSGRSGTAVWMFACRQVHSDCRSLGIHQWICSFLRYDSH